MMKQMIHAIRGPLLETWSRLQLRIALRNVHRQMPIIVYQMGKVGSSTVVSTLEKLGLPNPVLHVHTLVADRMNAAEKLQRSSTRPALDSHLIVSSILLSKLSRGRFPCKIITLTREPIARTISFAFEDWKRRAPGALAEDGTLDAAAMTEVADTLLRNRGGHADPGKWFDRELKQVFDLDVFSIPYDEERGYSIIRNPDVSLLILRMEDMNRSLPGALADFLGIDANSVVMSRANESEGKWYSDSANAVKREFRLPDEILNEITTSRFIRHFYPNDIERLRDRWGQLAVTASASGSE
jgi:Putative capsular polysaccharide synthesis protein